MNSSKLTIQECKKIIEEQHLESPKSPRPKKEEYIKIIDSFYQQQQQLQLGSVQRSSSPLTFTTPRRNSIKNRKSITPSSRNNQEEEKEEEEKLAKNSLRQYRTLQLEKNRLSIQENELAEFSAQFSDSFLDDEGLNKKESSKFGIFLKHLKYWVRYLVGMEEWSLFFLLTLLWKCCFYGGLLFFLYFYFYHTNDYSLNGYGTNFMSNLPYCLSNDSNHDCEPCPSHGICLEGRKLSCIRPYEKLEMEDRCILPEEWVQLQTLVRSMIYQSLLQSYTVFYCEQSFEPSKPLNLYGLYVEQRKLIQLQLSTGIFKDHSVLFWSLLDLHDILMIDDSKQSISFVSPPELPVLCQVQRFCYFYGLTLFILLILIFGSLFGLRYFLRSRRMKQWIEKAALYSKEQLFHHAQMYSNKQVVHRFISDRELKESILVHFALDASSRSLRDNIWKMVRFTLAQDPGILYSNQCEVEEGKFIEGWEYLL